VVSYPKGDFVLKTDFFASQVIAISNQFWQTPQLIWVLKW